MTSCFFCQNLLSDFIEGILPATRQEEMKQHLGGCESCRSSQADLEKTLQMLRSFPPLRLTSEASLRLSEASQPGRLPFFTRRIFSRAVLATAAGVLVLAATTITFPDYFSWIPAFRSHKEEAQFARYYPLTQGAAEILEEQASWLHSKTEMTGSLWDEGGLSPEEFEKTFQGKSSRQTGSENSK